MCFFHPFSIYLGELWSAAVLSCSPLRTVCLLALRILNGKAAYRRRGSFGVLMLVRWTVTAAYLLVGLVV